MYYSDYEDLLSADDKLANVNRALLTAAKKVGLGKAAKPLVKAAKTAAIPLSIGAAGYASGIGRDAGADIFNAMTGGKYNRDNEAEYNKGALGDLEDNNRNGMFDYGSAYTNQYQASPQTSSQRQPQVGYDAKHASVASMLTTGIKSTQGLGKKAALMTGSAITGSVGWSYGFNHYNAAKNGTKNQLTRLKLHFNDGENPEYAGAAGEKLAGSVSTNTLPNLNPVREENLKIPGQSTAKPASGGSKGAYNVQPSQYDDTNKSGKSTLNDISEVVQTETATPGPNGKATSPDGQIHEGLRHAHASVYDTVKISASSSAPAVSGVRTVNGGETIDNSATDNNYANTGQYGDKTTMNTVDFQTNSKVDKLTALSERLDKCIAKTATYNFNPEEGHFQRLLRRKGEEALAKGDKTGAVKIAVAMNALDALEKDNFDKTAAILDQAGRNIIRDLRTRSPEQMKALVKQITREAASNPALESALTGAVQNMNRVSHQAGKIGELIGKNEHLSNIALGLGGGALATGVAALLPRVENPTNVFTKAYNNLVDHPVQTGIGVGLLSPALATGMLGYPSKTDVQNIQNVLALGGAGTLAHNATRFDRDKGPDSELLEMGAGVNRNVPDTTLSNVAKGGAIGGLGGLGLAAAANAVGDLGFGLDDYAKYTLAGAALGAGAGAVYRPFATNYNRDVNYLR